MKDEKVAASNETSDDSSTSAFRLHPSSLPVITLLTDFGTADYFAGAMKGAILCVNPRASVVDLTHEIPPHDIEAGAFTLLSAYTTFPKGTIHVAVVDPGVGSARRPILVATEHYFFLGPDNGLFQHIYRREAGARVFHLSNENYFRQPVSATFHGRDVFAPVAGALSMGVEPSELGPLIKDYVRGESFAVKQLEDGEIEASVIHTDRFGNLITNLTREDLTEEMIEQGARLTVREREITTFKQFFAEEGTQDNELFAVWGSAGFLEIAAFKRSAARLLNIARGERVRLKTAARKLF